MSVITSHESELVSLKEKIAREGRGPGGREAYAENARILELEVQLKRLKDELAAERALHQRELSEIFKSTSWRITRPLRWLKDQASAVSTTMHRFSVMVDRHGGLKPLLKRSVAVFRERGIAGVVSQLKGAQAAELDYGEWLRRYDALNADDVKRMVDLVKALPRKPLISVLMPVYNPRLEWLLRAVASVQAQIYPNWELCIADDASSDPTGREALARLAAQDSRIRIMHRSQNGHISAASNSAMGLVQGEWTALMDQDDLLPIYALAWIADAVNRHPDLQLIYSDEDKINDADRRFDPYFKSDWNIDLFLSQNMFSHLGVYRTDLLRDVGGFRKGFEGAQDYDLVLRCVERIRLDQIHHIPKVLYHWRVHADSTASAIDAKPYAQIAGARALNEHLQRTKVAGHVETLDHGYRVHYDLPEPPPRVSLIIPTRNAKALVRQCVDSIVALTTYPDYEIIIVDNGSDDESAVAYFESLASRPNFKVIRDDSEFNYSALNNKAVALASGGIVGLVNNDIEVMSPGWLSEMVSIALQPGVGAVGARLWYPDDTLQHGGVVLGIGGVAGHAHKRLPQGRPGYFQRARLIQSFSAVTAACLMVRKDHYLSVGGLDETHLKVAFNDVDFCLRLREAGLRNVWTPYAELYHHESATRGDDISPEKQARFASEVDYMLARWGDALNRDPGYNPNLTLVHEDFSFAWPPIKRED